jgi:hypothetical protein
VGVAVLAAGALVVLALPFKTGAIAPGAPTAGPALGEGMLGEGMLGEGLPALGGEAA